ncbi:DinB family protein [Rhodococcus sp. BP-316]|uniref:DinB family protein n=1 Tax=Rhodococcus sp. BP-316 TaxID=2739445 RepID=UPI001C9B3CA9|nr:DinB family protein [Rhodococcus sp. BP-316]MBY6682995.1 DinB family protein [Rhodococcus sp. BP-316]
MTDPVNRVEPPFVADEVAMLESWLDYHRATLLWKCHGLTDTQLTVRSIPPSTLSLLGLVRHLTEVERSWYARRLAGRERPPLYYSDAEPDGDFDSLDSTPVAEVFAAYERAVQESRALAVNTDLEALSIGTVDGLQVSLRWIHLHLIKEYARHNGHADLLRQCIDGDTGE